MSKKPFYPTRTCPHRWCRNLHLAPVPFCLALVAFDLWHNWIYLVLLVMSILMTSLINKMVHFRRQQRSTPTTIQHVIQDLRESPGPLDLEMEDTKYAGTGWRTLEVRKGWACVAIGCDIVFAALMGLATTAIFAHPAEGAKEASSTTLDGGMLVSLIVGGAFIGFSLYAHKKATQPRKPKRAWVPAFLRTNA